jgi:hypothetical protein
MSNHRKDQKDAGLAAELHPVPSQAEGEDDDARKNRGPGTGERPRPSQAEGDLETIEADLKQKSKRIHNVC